MDTSEMRWMVPVDMDAAKLGIAQLAILVGFHYRAVLKETGNQALAEKLTVEYQNAIINPLQRPKSE